MEELTLEEKRTKNTQLALWLGYKLDTASDPHFAYIAVPATLTTKDTRTQAWLNPEGKLTSERMPWGSLPDFLDNLDLCFKRFASKAIVLEVCRSLAPGQPTFVARVVLPNKNTRELYSEYHYSDQPSRALCEAALEVLNRNSKNKNFI